MSIRKLFQDLFVTKDRQWTFCWCANCANELCADKRTTFTDVEGVVTYKCGECGKQQRFLFDAPVPIYLGEAAPPERE